MSRTETHERRVVDEVLGDVAMFTASASGPNGPWPFRSLTLYRRRNRILVRDVDGREIETIDVHDLPDGDDAALELTDRLLSLNRESLDSL